MSDLLRSLWDEPRPPNAPQRVWRDWALVGGLFVLTVLEGVLRPDMPWRTVSVILLVALLPTLLWRRTRPLLMLALAYGLAGLLPLPAAPLEAYATGYLLIFPYSLFRWGTGREAILGSLIILGKVGVYAILGYVSLADAVGGFVVLFATTSLGAAFRYRAAVRLRGLEQVKLLERERLARDLHDTVAHHVSAMAIRAQAGLATLATNPDAAGDALRVIEAEASRALAEMRAMVRVLRRDDPAELAPTPTVTDLEHLASTARTVPVVDVELSGDVDAVPPAVGTAIYRLAQESITNARRHARHATRIVVRVAADDTSVRLRVSDDGDSVATRSPGSQGYGLIGMIERTDLLGGTFEAGPNADRGWTVTAVLPRTGSPT